MLPEPSLEPHSYYADGSGFSICIKTQRDIASNEQPSRDGLKVGVLGLGIGSMLSWATPEDEFVFYEINPKVEEIAREWFTFLDSHEKSEVVIGDGRIMLEMETKKGIDRQFDLLAIDAFSSDSIPVHLLTDECFDVYQKHLKEDGILLFHISNRFINLKPVVFATTKKRGLTASYVVHKSSEDESISGSDWILVTNEKVANHTRLKSAATDYQLPANAPQWTDDFASLAPVMNWSIAISWEKMFEGQRMKKKTPTVEQK
jgi:spermidine synthase